MSKLDSMLAGERAIDAQYLSIEQVLRSIGYLG